MSVDTHFRINQPSVIGEVIDGEAIIVNLDSGTYYSLRDTGSAVWRLIEQGVSLLQIIEQMTRLYDDPASLIETEVRALIAKLQAENLIVSQNVTASPIANAENANDARLPFSEPILEKYTDMADLLLLDPIHEVGQLDGWPHSA